MLYYEIRAECPISVRSPGASINFEHMTVKDTGLPFCTPGQYGPVYMRLVLWLCRVMTGNGGEDRVSYSCSSSDTKVRKDEMF